MRAWFLLVALTFAASAIGGPPASRWDPAFKAWAEADGRTPPAPGGVVFVGSSSIRLWDGLERDFEVPVLARGFGGSRIADCVENLDRLVLQYRPRLVLLYAGDNDLAEGSSPQQVLERFKSFAAGVQDRLPDTRVGFISIKPSPARRALLDKARTANRLVRDYVAAAPDLIYIDVFKPMLGEDGMPRAALFRDDDLHLNAHGYALWRSVIGPHLR